MQDTSSARSFTGRVAVVFGTQVLGSGIAILNGILLARLLGPAAKGDYYLLILVPATATALTLLGLPQAFGFFAARGKTQGIVIKALLLATGLAALGFLGALALMPVLHESVLHSLPFGLVLVAFLAVPLALSAAFAQAIVMGRQAVRWYAAISIGVPVLTTILTFVVVGLLDLSVTGALAVYLITLGVQAAGFAIGATHLSAANEAAAPVSLRDLLGYAIPFYPANLTVHFNYRIDGYIIAWLISDASESLGYYSMAVALAELVFYFPNAVSILFFPHVAGSPREQSDRQVAMVSRVTLLVSAIVGLLLVPASALMIWLLLPAFTPSLLPYLVLLPGVVAISSSKVVAGYITGINRPGVSSTVSIAVLVINIVANLLLIPRIGIIGAAAASMISYSSSSLLLTVIAARISHTPITSFWIPRKSDGAYVVWIMTGMIRRLRDRWPAVLSRLDA